MSTPNQPLAAQPQYHTDPSLAHSDSAAAQLLGSTPRIDLPAPPIAVTAPHASQPEYKIPGTSAWRLAAALESWFARNPYQWTCCMTVRFDASVTTIVEARKAVRRIVTDYRFWTHAYLWVLQIHDNHIAVQILAAPGFDCLVATDLQAWGAPPLDALNSGLRAEAYKLLQRPECKGTQVAPIVDPEAIRVALIKSLFPAHISRLFGRPLWGCSKSVLRKSFRFPCITVHDMYAAWQLERRYEEALINGTVVAEPWTQPHFCHPYAPTHPLQAGASL